MKRIDHATAVAERFTGGNPATGTPATIVTYDWLNQVQEEICTVIEDAGITLDGEAEDQLLLALTALYLQNAAAVAYDNTDSGLTAEDVQAALDEIVDSISTGSSGVSSIWIGAGAMTPSQTSGAYPSGIEDTTNDLTRSCMIFGHDADTSTEFEMSMPGNWDGGTLKAKAYWTALSGTAGNDIGFSLAARAINDDDALDQALGTAVTITDDLIASGDLHVSAASAAMTVAGTPAGGQLVRFKLTRDFDYGASALAENVQLLGVYIQFTTTGDESAW